MKKSISLALIAIMVFMTACNGSVGSGAAADSSKESVDSEAPENEEKAAEKDNTDSLQSISDVSYAEQNGLEFGSFSPLSKDYLLLFFDNKTYEEVDNEDFHVIDKGKADYNFYDVKAWPADKAGYTTVKMTYAIDCKNRCHAPVEWGNVGRWIQPGDVSMFDYYTGKYIPTSDIQKSTSGSGSRETEAVETTIEFEGKTWSLSAWEEIHDVSYFSNYNYTDENHYDFTGNFSRVCSLFVTYPDDYDGLSFAIETKGEIEKDLAEIKNQIEGVANRYIGKDILSVYDDAKKEDILFSTMKDGAVPVEKVGSADDAAIPSYKERNKLVVSPNPKDLEKDFSIMYDFYVFDENGNVLDDSIVPVNKYGTECSYGAVTQEDLGDGKVKVTIPYHVSGYCTVDVTNCDNDFSGFASFHMMDAFDGITGETIEIGGDYEDNSDWGDWINDNELKYEFNVDARSEIVIPKDKVSDTIVGFGDRTIDDSYYYLDMVVEKGSTF